MAETVKKSRIVSEDDLEESLMQEFNMRLKNCMSQEDEKETNEEEPEHLYDNVRVVRAANGKTEVVSLVPDVIYDDVMPTSCKNFIEIERRFCSENVSDAGRHRQQNEPDEVQTTDLDVNVELLPEKTDFENDEHVYETIESESIYENVQSVQHSNNNSKPNLTLPTTCLTDMSDEPNDEAETQEAKSVKDRMFLSTDDASCLLFTQTVTSPMLTPSEENIDFLKGFRRQSSQNTLSDATNSNGSPKFEEDTDEISAKDLDRNDENPEQNPTYDDVSEADNAIVCSIVVDDTHVKAPPQGETYQNVERQPTVSAEDGDVRLEDLKQQSRLFLEREIGEAEKDSVSHIHDICRDTENIYENVDGAADGVDDEDVDETFDNEDGGGIAVQLSQPNGELVLLKGQELDEIEIRLEEPDVAVDSTPEKMAEATDGRSCAGAEDVKMNGCVEKASIDVDDATTNGGFVETGKMSEEKATINEEKTVVSEEKATTNEAKVTVNGGGISGQVVATTNYEDSGAEMATTNGGIAAANKGTKFDGEGRVEDEEEEEERVTAVDGDRSDNPSQLVNALKTKYLHNATAEIVKTPSIEKFEIAQLKTLDIMKQISKFESKSPTKEDAAGNEGGSTDSTETTESTTYTETATFETNASMQDKSLKKKKSKKSRSHEKENISVNNTNSDANSPEENFYNVNVKNLCRSFGDLTKIGWDEKYHNERNTRDKSSFNKFDALQKKNVLHVRSSDSSKAQEKFNGSTPVDASNCKSCGKVVFQMEQMKAEKSIWHKNCFRCQECSKQLTVDTYESHEGALYCKPHFKALFAPKVIEDDIPPSDKPDLGLEELHSLNVRERFQVFEQQHHHEDDANANSLERTSSGVNVKRSPSILSKLARFQAKGMDVGVTDDSLNGIPIEESSSEEEEVEQVEGEDADLVRAKKAQKEKPFHFVQMSDVKSKWEHGEQHVKDERREERKQEIQSIRSRLFMGKQGKMKEAYQQAVMESESNVKKSEAAPVDVCDTRTLKEKFEKGEVYVEDKDKKEAEDMSVFESGISKKSRSIFLELDANASKAPQMSPVSPPKGGSDVRKTREVFLARQASDDVVKSSEQVDDVKIETSDIQQRFKFFETYREPEQTRRAFRITPPREGQVKSETPEREIYRDPDIVRAEEHVEDSVIAKETHTATKVLNKFRQMEENLNKEPLPLGPKPLKRFTPPPEPARPETTSEEEGSETDEESEGGCEQPDHAKVQDADLLEAQKAARARQLRAKFERWEANEIKREQSVNIAEELGEDQSQIESTKALRARFESLRDTSNDVNRAPRAKVNRFVDTTSTLEVCNCCKGKVYPLEKISVHGHSYHKSCFKCKECNTVLRMESYTYNQGLLYCVPHFKRLFISKGNYDTAFGLEKWNASVA